MDVEKYLTKSKAEFGLLIKILGIIGFLVILILLAGYLFIRIRAPHMIEFSKGIVEYQVKISLNSLDGAQFIKGMNGCENILPVKDSSIVFVSCLDGNIHRLDYEHDGHYRIMKSYKAGEVVTGLAISADGSLFAAVCDYPIGDWTTKGGKIYRISSDLSAKEKVTGDYPSMNGICFDPDDNLYLTTSNFNYFRPEGQVLRMSKTIAGSFSQPEIYIPEAGLANGLFYDERQNIIFLSNTLDGIYDFSASEKSLNEVYLKLKFMEACDDLCTDISGNVWMTDPGMSTVKVFNPGTNRLVRFVIDGIGQTSSCRIRSEKGQEMLFITELKQSQRPTSGNYDGRGVLVVPANSLLKLLESILINNNREQ